MAIINRKSASIKLKGVEYGAKEGDTIEICEWGNAEGWDFTIIKNGETKLFSLSFAELECINYLQQYLQLQDKIIE
jgi:hypothetical protein